MIIIQELSGKMRLGIPTHEIHVTWYYEIIHPCHMLLTGFLITFTHTISASFMWFLTLSLFKGYSSCSFLLFSTPSLFKGYMLCFTHCFRPTFYRIQIMLHSLFRLSFYGAQVMFHPSKPFLFIASRKHVKVSKHGTHMHTYNLLKQFL